MTNRQLYLAVKLDGQAFALYEEGVKKGTVPLHLLDRVVLRGNVQLESRLLGALSERNIGLLVLSGRNTEATAMLAARSHGDSMRRLGDSTGPVWMKVCGHRWRVGWYWLRCAISGVCCAMH